MSTLEFVSSIKWPVTVLILAAMATVVLKRSPGTRQSVGTWFSRRNLRLNVGGQEFEATVAETQGSIGAAISLDSELAEAAGRSPEAGAEEQSSGSASADREVETQRRKTVGALARNAVRLGWLWGRGEHGASEPLTSVTWDPAGNPMLRVIPKDGAAAEIQRVLNDQNISLDRDQVFALRDELRRRGWIPTPAAPPSPSAPQQGSTDGDGDAAP